MLGGPMEELARAVALEERGEWSEAAALYRGALGGSLPVPTRQDVLIRLAQCLLETGGKGRPDEAEECLAEAQGDVEASRDPALLCRFHLVKGRLHDVRGEIGRAIACYQQAALPLKEGDPQHVQSDLLLASAERRHGELQSALDRLDRVDADRLSDRLRAEYLDELGAVHLARGDTQRAIAILERGLQLDESTASEYGAGRSRLLLAEAYLRSGMRRKAKAEIDQAVAAFGREQAESGLSEAYALLGSWHEEGEDYVNAAHFYLKGLELDRLGEDLVGQARAKRCLGRLFRKRGDSERAKEYFAEARDLLPRGDDVEMAALYAEEGHLALGGSDPDYSEAIECFSRALRIADEDGDQRAVALAQRSLARAYANSNEPDQAINLLRQAERTLRDLGDLRELDDLLDDLGEVFLDQGKYEEALVRLGESLELDRRLGTVGSQGRTLLLFGRTLLQIGRREEAGENFEKALNLFELAELDVGRSEALHDLGSWYAEEGRLAEAIRCFRKGLDLDKRLNDTLGVVQANRSLASVYRRRGDLERAAEFLDEAEQELRGTRDDVERAMLDMERGRLELASGSYREARGRIRKARQVFAGKSAVEVATCDRLLANIATAEGGRYREAEALLMSARDAFDSARDFPELDEVWDDLGVVYLRTGRLQQAYDAVTVSLGIGERMGWGHGKARSLLLLAEIATQRGEMSEAFQRLDEARRIFAESDDEVGLSDAFQLFGDWWASDRNPDRDFSKASYNFKEARRLDQAHRDLRGMGRCNTRLASVYRQLGQHHRATEALEQAEENLRGLDDIREVAPLLLERACLHEAKGEYAQAIPHLRRALQAFKELGDDEATTRTYHLLISCHQHLHQVQEALEYIRELGLDYASMWHVLLKDLHPIVATAAEGRFSHGDYRSAVTFAFESLAKAVRLRAKDLQPPPAPTDSVSDVVKRWLASGLPDLPTFAKQNTLSRFSEFVIASFDLCRNSAVHGSEVLTARDAFISLAVAHLIASVIDPEPLADLPPGPSNLTKETSIRW